MSYKLFLDDLRMPKDVLNYMPEMNDLYSDENWSIARNYNEFRNIIIENLMNSGEMPTIISFDHDLGLEHTRFYFENGGHDNPPNPDNAEFIEKTGKDCANWLVNFCEDKSLNLPEYYVHSKNPVGGRNIHSLLTQYKNFKQNGR